MSMEKLDKSYAEIQRAQVNYILTIRDLAVSDPLTAAFHLSISKIDALNLAQMSIVDIQDFFSKSPPLLTLKSSEVEASVRGNSPLSVILEFIKEGGKPEDFGSTFAHISALPKIHV